MKNIKRAIKLLKEIADYGESLWDEENFRDGYKKVDSGILCDVRAFLKEEGISLYEDEEDSDLECEEI